MKNYFYGLFLSLLISTGPAYSQSTITFDDLSGYSFNPSSQIPVPYIQNGYDGFNWNNIFTVNSSGYPLSGFVNGMVSPNNVAVGCYSSPSSISSITPFVLVSGFFTSAHQNAMSLEIIGLNGTTTVFDETSILNVNGPSYLTFPSTAVTEVDFTVSGGVASPVGYLGGAQEMVLDNLTVAPVPEPSSALLITVGLGTLNLLRLRRNK